MNLQKSILLSAFMFCSLLITAQTVNIQLKNVTVKKAMSELKKQTGYAFVYEASDLDVTQVITVNASDLKQAITQILSGQNAKYEIKGKKIVVSYKPQIPSGAQKQTTQVKPKQHITGQILDHNGDPIIGATIMEKGTSNGTVSDINGKFALDTNLQSELEISYIGFKNQIVKSKQGQSLTVNMTEDIESLSDVVVVGYGTMKKSDLTGSVASANLKDFENSPNTNIAQALQGTVPGLNIGQITTAGSTPSISIRGENTISGNSSVLIVLDGIIYTSSLSSINPNDIASVDVLKDASATAVYGAQAANGVLLITTKKGKSGKPKLSFSSSYTISNPTKDLHPMNRSEYLQFTKDFWYDKAYMGPDYTTPNPDFNIAEYLPDTPMMDSNQPDGISALDYDWWGEGTQTGHIFENRLSVSGGTDVVSYLMSYENTDQSGYLKNDDFKRNSIRVNLDVTPNNWLKFGLQSFASFINQDGAEPALFALMVSNPLISPYDANGDIVPYPFNTLDENPFRNSNVSDRERHNYFFANAYAEVKLPVKGLTYRINFGNNYRIDNHDYASIYGASLMGEAYKDHAEYYDYTVDNILNYNGQFGKHSVGMTLLYGASERKYNSTNADARNFSRLALGYNDLSLGAEQYTKSSAWDEALLYQMGRINYKYDDKYLVTATVRRDGYSGFAKNNKFAIFPSLALAWVLSQEKFFKAKWVDQLKLRAGWGISGNQTSRYKSLAKMTTSSAYVFGDGSQTEFGQMVSTMANNDLKWEKTTGMNFGLDFVLFNNRLSGTLDVYSNTTKDLLYDLSIPTMTGFSLISSNIGKLRNKGIEFTLTSRNFVTKDFEWSTTFNISSNSNKIISLTGLDNDGDGKEDDLIASNLFIGKAISSIYTYKIDGIWQLHDDIPTGYHPGNYRVVDTNGDGETTVDDRTIIGKTSPAYRFGILNTLRYKSFNLSFFINSIQGGSNGYLGKNSETLVRGDTNARRWNRISELAADYWSPNNPNATYSRCTQIGTINPTRYQSRSFVRLQDVTLGYTIPQIWVNKIGLEHLNLFISGKNLLTFTNWKGWDPEANSGYGGRPVLRSISFGLNLTL